MQFNNDANGIYQCVKLINSELSEQILSTIADIRKPVLTHLESLKANRRDIESKVNDVVEAHSLKISTIRKISTLEELTNNIYFNSEDSLNLNVIMYNVNRLRILLFSIESDIDTLSEAAPGWSQFFKQFRSPDGVLEKLSRAITKNDTRVDVQLILSQLKFVALTWDNANVTLNTTDLVSIAKAYEQAYQQ